jgi:GDPmannose 4,6-dehydratase
MTVNYRESYDLFAINGILFNHESPRRGETFVTKKITKGIANIVKGKQKYLELGNLNAKRDWGHAKDFVVAMWLMMQQQKPDDFVIATGKQYSVRQFVNMVSKKLGIKVIWKGKGVNEKGINALTKKTIIECDKNYFRPLDVNTLLGDAKKARKILKWKPKINIHQLVNDMVEKEEAPPNTYAD